MVNSAGIVTANSAGFAVITVKTADGAKTAECNVTVTPSTAPVAVTGVSLGETTLSVNEGASAELAAIIEPSNATNKAVIWSSDKTSVAAVDENGVITGKAVGIAKITATTVDGEKTTSCTVTVNPPPVSDVSLDKTELSVIVGANATLKATVAPTGAVNKTVTWTSSKTSVAEVDSNGVVAGKAVGTATITATTVDGGKVAICNVTVNPVPVTGVSLSKTSLAFAVGDAVTTSALTATVAPANAANKAVTWASSDAKIATVSSGGVVTMKSVGVATITAKTADGGKIANCAVTVKLGKPTIASVVSGGDKKVKVTWGKIASAKSYDVYAKLSTETDYTKVASGITGTSSAITIKSYAKYNFKVDAVFSNAACNSAHSGAMSFITLLAPTGLAGDSNGSAVTVSWSKAPGATSYIVYRSSAASGTYTKIGTATTLSYEDKNAVKNKQNYYKVKAHNETASYTTTSVLSSYKSVDNVLALSWPISNGSSKVTSGFGPRVSPAPGASSNHLGIDIGVPSGTSVMAAADGTVTFAGISGSLTTGYGRLIEINHGNGLVTRYGHNSSLVAKAGQKVKRGDLIAKVGSTGVSTGPHCHFEVRISGEAKNPRTYLK
jgi:uncharacterized protein YjdB/murein DD-endopeptidase MepM/ murein hydrolase activator NlpD